MLLGTEKMPDYIDPKARDFHCVVFAVKETIVADAVRTDAVGTMLEKRRTFRQRLDDELARFEGAMGDGEIAPSPE